MKKNINRRNNNNRLIMKQTIIRKRKGKKITQFSNSDMASPI